MQLGPPQARIRMERYQTLDALRGVAALAIVVYHLNELRIDAQFVPHGYLAVDFFFVLSGFVIAHAYTGPLLGALSWGRFILRRMIRLYPLVLLGALLGFGVLLVKWRFVPDKVDGLPRLALSGLLSALMIPSVVDGPASRSMVFPSDPPLWSLFFELVVNFAWAWIGVRAPAWILGTVVLVGGAVLVKLALAHGSLDLGWEFPTFWGGAVRSCFGFSLGLLLYRLRDRLPSVSGAAVPVIAPAILGVALLAAFAVPDGVLHASASVRDLVCAFLVLPGIVVLGIGQGESGRLGTVLGELSYPIYVLHFPLLTLAAGVHEKLLPQVDPHLISAVAVAVVLGASVLALTLYDRPVRRWLARTLAGSAVPVPGAPRPLPAA